jgi:L-ascorbate metabolism protein UlaG (beta-lactamase superfamily)
MQLTWYGHAAFRLETGDCAVITDPYNYPLAGGYEPIDAPADIVTISHENPKYHSDTSAIQPPFELLNGLNFLDKPVTVRGITFQACLVYENPEREGPNAMIRFNIGGLEVVHMGDVGHPLNTVQLDFLRGADLLLAPTGGKPTIAMNDLVVAIAETRPRVVIPMHFKTPKINLPIRPVEEFLAQPGLSGMTIRRFDSSTISVTKADLPDATQVWVMPFAR